VKVWVENDDVALYQGDALSVLKRLPDGCSAKSVILN